MSRVVMTIGSFDVLHRDHISLFDACRNIAGKKGTVLAGLNTDEFIERHKGRKPLLDQDNRSLVLASLKQVDHWFWNEYNSIIVHLETYQPDYLVIGSDWHAKDYLAQIGVSFQELHDLSCYLVYVPTLERIHSSDIREAK